jgi:tRNA pseudouridine13 synthase
MLITDPLPQRFLTDDAGIGGCIKARAEDFVVEEIPRYDPCGSGEHLYLGVQKQDVSHTELVATLRRHFDVPEKAIGYAGMKDKRAVTRQTVSVHLREDPPSLDIEHARITVLWAKRHTNKLRRGHLVGNRFVVRIRDVDPVRTPAVHRTISRLETIGVPGYFGGQRFGYRLNNHLIGAMLLNGDWTGAMAELLGTTGSPFPEYQRERREAFDAGRHAEALAAWSTSDRAERIALGAFSRGASPKTAMRAVGPTMLNFWASALASAAFNRVLDARVGDGTCTTLLDGDLAWKHDSRAVFAVTREMVDSGELTPRLAALEISPSGPLWGDGMTTAAGAVGRREREALAATGVDAERVTRGSGLRPEGARRPLRSPLGNPDVEGGFDEHGPYIRLAFDLARGLYATIVLREIMKGDGADRSSDGGTN